MDLGTGIFRTPALVFTYTHSVSVSMFWWCVGAVVGMCGIVVFMELGLTLPLYRFDGVDISVPRSGGELNYVSSPASSTTPHVLISSAAEIYF